MRALSRLWIFGAVALEVLAMSWLLGQWAAYDAPAPVVFAFPSTNALDWLALGTVGVDLDPTVDGRARMQHEYPWWSVAVAMAEHEARTMRWEASGALPPEPELELKAAAFGGPGWEAAYMAAQKEFSR